MKKKIEVLMQDSRLAGNAALERLYKGYQSAKNALEKSKTEKAKAKTAYRSAVGEEGKKNRETVLELRTAFRQAKYMQQYHRAGFDLAEYRLSLWLENWLSERPEPHTPSPPKQKKAVKAIKKVAKPTPAPAPVTAVKKRTPRAKPNAETQQ